MSLLYQSGRLAPSHVVDDAIEFESVRFLDEGASIIDVNNTLTWIKAQHFSAFIHAEVSVCAA